MCLTYRIVSSNETYLWIKIRASPRRKSVCLTQRHPPYNVTLPIVTIPFCYVANPPVSYLHPLQQKRHSSIHIYFPVDPVNNGVEYKGLDRTL